MPLSASETRLAMSASGGERYHAKWQSWVDSCRTVNRQRRQLWPSAYSEADWLLPARRRQCAPVGPVPRMSAIQVPAAVARSEVTLASIVATFDQSKQHPGPSLALAGVQRSNPARR